MNLICKTTLADAFCFVQHARFSQLISLNPDSADSTDSDTGRVLLAGFNSIFTLLEQEHSNFIVCIVVPSFTVS
jgi:hypothetical protein